MAGEAGDVLVGYTGFSRDKNPQSVVAFFGTVDGSTDPIRPTVLKVLNDFSSFKIEENSDIMEDTAK